MQTDQDPRVFDSEAREAAKLEFEEHVRPRRQKAGVENDPEGAWGLALSGGGIRSATFCLGLVRGLAGSGLLKRFDYLSTVSGGGYLGASLGRLYSDKDTAAKVEQRVASADSMWLWWLRNNGRYLTPAGAKDLGFAAASITRGVISTHLEIGVLIVFMALLVLLPHLLVSLFPPFLEGTPWNYGLVSTMPSVWGWLLVLPAFACLHQICAYWYTRDVHSHISITLIAIAAFGSLAISSKAMEEAFAGNSAAKYILAILAVAPVSAALAAYGEEIQHEPVSAQRLRRTKRLAYSLWALGIGVALLLLDCCTWQLTRWFWGGDLYRAMYRIGGTVVVLAAIGRLVLPELQRWMATVKGPSLNVERTLNVLGIALSILVAVLWTSVLSAWLFPASSRGKYWTPAWETLRSIPPIMTFALVTSLCLAYLLSTRRSFDLLNLASLHNFYRARIERAYVSSGNSGTPASRFQDSALDPVSPSSTTQVAPLTEAIVGDDIDVSAYRPHEWGGPIHLVNCCINQSLDDRTGLYNADRKGVVLTVSSLGIEAGTTFPDGTASLPRVGNLSQWIAISGAAASTGMGSRTSPGFAALLFMSGIRLGYWTPSLMPDQNGSAKGAVPGLLRWAPKPFAIVAESLARFPGLSSPLWYVSDGGHFDNTGIYALLKRRPKVIVAADCGADPKYLFGDLESLVRKAKIDYRATIEFVKNTSGSVPAELREVLGTPETIQPELGSQWLVLGRITYSDGSVGMLIVVKPRRLDAMPFDMVAYADRHADFPQQTTGDQFFDEAQWESYHQLGLLMGASITPALMDDAWGAVNDSGAGASSLELTEKQGEIAEAKAERGRRAGLTVRATVGAGLSLSLLVAAWQGFEQYRESKRTEQRAYEARILELSQKIQTQPVESLLEEQFASLARESMERGDTSFDTVLKRLNSRCESQADPKQKTDCLDLYRKVQPSLKKKPVPFYDYWFADKLPDYQRSLLEAARGSSSALKKPSPSSAGAVAGTNASRPNADSATSTASTGQASGGQPASTGGNPGTVAQGQTQGQRPHNEGNPGSDDDGAKAPPRCADNVRLFVHVYDEESRPAARQLGKQVMQAVGASELPIENVVSTARRFGRATPYVWSQATLVYPATSTQACITRARAAAGDAVATQAIGFGKPNDLELWLAPRTVKDASTQGSN